MLFEFIKERMKSYPQQTVSDGVTTVTYMELIEQAERLAAKLDGKIYALLCNSELNTAIGLLSCLCAKRIAMPLSAKYGTAHYEKIIEHIQPDGIITDKEIHQTKYSNSNSLKDTAVIMCSSGTTGSPKGIMLSEQNLLANLLDIEKYMPVDHNDYMLISRPIYHCAVMTSELLYGLIRGARILFYNDNLNPKRLYRIIEEEKISVTSATPTIFYYLSKYINAGQFFCCLKTIAISGECMTTTVADELIRAMPDTQKFNVYGLTEASPRVSYLPCDLFDENPTSVGIPLDSVRIKIENDELLVKSPSVMQGYYMNQAMTDNVLSDGWLHTGDIAEIKDGLLYIKCRKDNMIIRAGMNIYPQEIENSLKKDDRIIDVLAYGIKDSYVGERIALKVVSKELSYTDVFRICHDKLPSFQHPDRIEIVDSLEHTASGKLIRKR